MDHSFEDFGLLAAGRHGDVAFQLRAFRDDDLRSLHAALDDGGARELGAIARDDLTSDRSSDEDRPCRDLAVDVSSHCDPHVMADADLSLEPPDHGHVLFAGDSRPRIAHSTPTTVVEERPRSGSAGLQCGRRTCFRFSKHRQREPPEGR